MKLFEGKIRHFMAMSIGHSWLVRQIQKLTGFGVFCSFLFLFWHHDPLCCKAKLIGFAWTFWLLAWTWYCCRCLCLAYIFVFSPRNRLYSICHVSSALVNFIFCRSEIQYQTFPGCLYSDNCTLRPCPYSAKWRVGSYQGNFISRVRKFCAPNKLCIIFT